MDDTDILTFEGWHDPLLDGFGPDPDGTYARLAWLPIVGPSSFLLWGTLATQLRRERTVTWELADLAGAHGLQRGSGRNGMVRRTLTRLVQFHLLVESAPDTWLVHLSAPPVSRRQLERLPAVVAQLHEAAFQNPHRQVG